RPTGNTARRRSQERVGAGHRCEAGDQNGVPPHPADGSVRIVAEHGSSMQLPGYDGVANVTGRATGALVSATHPYTPTKDAEAVIRWNYWRLSSFPRGFRSDRLTAADQTDPGCLGCRHRRD